MIREAPGVPNAKPNPCPIFGGGPDHLGTAELRFEGGIKLLRDNQRCRCEGPVVAKLLHHLGDPSTETVAMILSDLHVVNR